MRAFLAVPTDPAWAESARGLSRALREALPPASWARPEAWHLTLRFLGEIDAAAVEAFARGLEARISGVEPGALDTSGPVVFPGRGRARVLGLGFSEDSGRSALETMAAAAEEAARAAGVAPERRRFHAHVTLARIREPWPADAIARFRAEAAAAKFPAWRYDRLILYESRLHPAGAVHTPLRTWSLVPREAGAPA